MKLIFSAFLILMTGCASFFNKQEPATTVTDISGLSRSDYYSHLAQNYFENEDYNSSIDHFRLALLHDKKNVQAHFGLAKAYQATNQSQLAFEELSEISTSNLDETNFKQISNFYLQTRSYKKAYQWAQSYFAANNSPVALWKMYEAALLMKNADLVQSTLDILKNSEQSKLMIYLAEGEAYKEFKDYDKALNSLKTAEEISPLDELVLKKMVQISSLKKDWSAVLSYGEKYMSYQKKTIFVSELTAQAATFLKDYDKAIENYKWLNENSDDVIYALKLAHVYFLNQDYAQAEKSYINVLDINPGHNEASYYLGLAYEALKKSSASERQLETVAKTSLYYPDAQIRLATKEYQSNQLKDALNRIQAASEDRPESAALYKAYADYLIEAKNFLKALNVVKKAESNVGLDADLYITKAYCEFKLGDQKAFSADLDRALKLDSSNVKIYEYLSLLWYQDRKQLSETEYLSKVALDLGSTNQHIQKILIWTYIDLNKLELASHLLEEQYDKNPRDVFYTEMLARIYQLQNVHSKAKAFSNYAEKLKLKNESQFNLEEKILNDSLVNDFQRQPASFDL